MNEIATCGIGLAASASLPTNISELLATMADVLDMHQQALDFTDENTRPEHHAYVTLVLEFRGVAAQLAAVAQRMIGYRDLPMGRHGEQIMSRQQTAFERFVRSERTLRSHLTEAIGEHEAMLRKSD